MIKFHHSNVHAAYILWILKATDWRELRENRLVVATNYSHTTNSQNSLENSTISPRDSTTELRTHTHTHTFGFTLILLLRLWFAGFVFLFYPIFNFNWLFRRIRTNEQYRMLFASSLLKSLAAYVETKDKPTKKQQQPLENQSLKDV